MNRIPGLFSSGTHPMLKNVKMVAPMMVDASECETTLQLGLFFDGTRNNLHDDKGAYSHSNIARLYQSYPVDASAGYYSAYIPGVGTPFPEIGETGASAKGAGYAVGGEGRILYGLLFILGAIYHHAISARRLFSDTEIRLLCSKEDLTRKADIRALRRNAGLLEPDPGNGEERNSFFREKGKMLKQLLTQQRRPLLKQCVLDVFGFSRGAAEARVFCSWLMPLLDDGKLCGVPLTIRFLGIFDTVAAAGLGPAVGGAATKVKTGHGDWARIESLRIPKAVNQCVHMVAMHELRKNFPLDEAAVNGTLPVNVVEIAYPGSHSDVGGGYAPGELGVSSHADKMVADSAKLSQIPLNHMYEYAVATGVPLNKKFATDERTKYSPYAIHPALESTYSAFLRELGPRPRRMYEWMRPYLSWRWQIGKAFTSLRQYREASEADRALLLEGNRHLIRDGLLLQSRGNLKEAQAHRRRVIWRKGGAYDMHHTQPALELAHVDDEAPVVFQDAISEPVTKVIGDFFDNYVHDSLAGFGFALEPTGYWRYRKAFQGTSTVVFAENDDEADIRDRA